MGFDFYGFSPNKFFYDEFLLLTLQSTETFNIFHQTQTTASHMYIFIDKICLFSCTVDTHERGIGRSTSKNMGASGKKLKTIFLFVFFFFKHTVKMNFFLPLWVYVVKVIGWSAEFRNKSAHATTFHRGWNMGKGWQSDVPLLPCGTLRLEL